jgi:hypothetical protein
LSLNWTAANQKDGTQRLEPPQRWPCLLSIGPLCY